MQIPLRQGRFFNDLDTPTTQKVTIIDEYFAQQYWPHEDPLGKRIRTGGLDSKQPWKNRPWRNGICIASK